jgi:ABC-2 type transport system ATP-binding protein
VFFQIQIRSIFKLFMLKIKNLGKSYNNNIVLENINITILPNQICCLLGKNGAGKSTIINIIAQITKQDEGTVFINGVEVNQSTVLVHENMGIVPHTDYLINELTGYQYLELQCIIHKMDKAETVTRIKSLAKYFLDAPSDLYKYINSYSAGLRMKIKIMASLLHKPQVLIMDEPFANLDPYSAESLTKFLTKFAQQNKNMVFIVSHDLLYVDMIATQICVLENKTIVFNDTKAEFTNNNLHSLSDKFLTLTVNRTANAEELNWLF